MKKRMREERGRAIYDQILHSQLRFYFPVSEAESSDPEVCEGTVRASGGALLCAEI